MSTARRYAEFAAREAPGSSPTYERLAAAVSRAPAVLALLDRLPPARRQPNLLFAVVRLLGGPVADPDAFVAHVTAGWPAIEEEMRVRATRLPGHRVSVEDAAVLAYAGLPAPPDATLHNVLALDGRPLAWAGPHGQRLAWFGGR